MTTHVTLAGTWDAVSVLLTYPDADAAAELVGACRTLEGGPEPLAKAARDFRTFVESTEPTQREELFTTVFDINPQCTLELGWHLYGEDYKRGSFLVDMRGLMAAIGVEETPELPDHLTHALRVLERLPSPKDEQFSTQYVQTGVSRMLDAYDNPKGPWHPLLRAVLETLEACYGETQQIEGNPSAESQGPYQAMSSAALSSSSVPGSSMQGGGTGGCSCPVPGSPQVGPCE